MRNYIGGLAITARHGQVKNFSHCRRRDVGNSPAKLASSERKDHQSSSSVAFRAKAKRLYTFWHSAALSLFSISLENHMIINLAAQWCFRWALPLSGNPPACVFLERLVGWLVWGLKGFSVPHSIKSREVRGSVVYANLSKFQSPTQLF